MHFNLIRRILWICIFISQAQLTLGLAFALVAGPLLQGAVVTLQWTLDGTEPAQGWDIWFATNTASFRLGSASPGSSSIVVTFPGGGDGVFQALSGTQILASSNVVQLAVTSALATGTQTFSAKETRSIASTTTSMTASGTADPASVSDPSRMNAPTTGALLGIIAATLAAIAVIVVASISLFLHKRRRHRQEAQPQTDVEKQLAEIIIPFDSQGPRSLLQRPRPVSPPPTLPLPSGRRDAFLSAQLERLADDRWRAAEEESVHFSPLSRVPSESTERPEETDRFPSSPPLPPIPESSSRREAYLAEQLQKMTAQRRPLSDAPSESIIFSPLSSVPSEDTVRPKHESTVSTIGDSPIQFRGPMAQGSSRPPW
ncbi:hypothetical protein C8J57DRAFT_1275735 [Mycena rebaudengoi]|nr:hypothetical protein C8J57DRAFT_1275735 [Mycena rebaudengoi]